MPAQTQPAPTAVVADDERLMREQIIGRLKDAWPELQIVGEASNGREAIAIVQREEPDIVFLDISMPGMDGIEAARALAGKVHVVFVTAHDEYAITRLRAWRGRLPAEAAGARARGDDLRAPARAPDASARSDE